MSTIRKTPSCHFTTLTAYALTVAALLATPQFSFAGSESGGGGRGAEIKFQDIRNDYLTWIIAGGAAALDFTPPPGVKLETTVDYPTYVAKMVGTERNPGLLQPGVVDVGFRSEAEEALITDKDERIEVAGITKTCRNFFATEKSKARIICINERYNADSPDERYKNTHHEYAVLARFEVNYQGYSEYWISTHTTESLADKFERRLVVKSTIAKDERLIKRAPVHCAAGGCKAEDLEGRYYWLPDKTIEPSISTPSTVVIAVEKNSTSSESTVFIRTNLIDPLLQRGRAYDTEWNEQLNLNQAMFSKTFFDSLFISDNEIEHQEPSDWGRNLRYGFLGKFHSACRSKQTNNALSLDWTVSCPIPTQMKASDNQVQHTCSRADALATTQPYPDWESFRKRCIQASAELDSERALLKKTHRESYDSWVVETPDSLILLAKARDFSGQMIYFQDEFKPNADGDLIFTHYKNRTDPTQPLVIESSKVGERWAPDELAQKRASLRKLQSSYADRAKDDLKQAEEIQKQLETLEESN